MEGTFLQQDECVCLCVEHRNKAMHATAGCYLFPQNTRALFYAECTFKSA